MFFNPRFKDVSDSGLARLIQVLREAGRDATAEQREYDWRNCNVPMRLISNAHLQQVAQQAR